MDVKLRENKKRMKEKEKLVIDEYLCINACDVCFCNLIREGCRITRKETSENEENF